MIRPLFGFGPWVFGVELVFSLIIIFLCLVIYFKTREAFKLTKHKGIDYFRKTFLFLVFAYLSRFISSILIIFGIKNGIRFPRVFFGPLILIFVGYFSTMAIICLFLSTSWKQIKWKHTGFFSHIVAAIVALLAFASREPIILISCQATLLLVTAVLSFKTHIKSKRFSKLFAIYILLFIFWIVGLVPLSSRGFFPREWIFFIHPLSFIIFIIIFYKVHKWLK
jgi:hypothetical protein